MSFGSTPPPCEMQSKEKNMVHTAVVKITGASSEVLIAQTKMWLWNGVCAAAYVQIETGDQAGHYLVLTNREACGEKAFADKVRRELSKIPGSPIVEWARPLTRRLQRLFAWGDAAAKREHIVRATKEGNVQELQALMPEIDAQDTADQDKLSSLPRLWDRLRGYSLALPDCQHDFYLYGDACGVRDKCAELKERAEREGRPFDEDATRRWLAGHHVGPCSRSASHKGPVWRCTQCNLRLCQSCAFAKHAEQEETEEVERLHAKAQQTPQAPPDGVYYEWRQHPHWSLPFYVTDQVKVADAEKVVWIRQEIGSDATLPDFCKKYLELFSDRKVGEIQQKTACLLLYARYCPESEAAAWKKEGDLPPRDMEEFQRVWDPKAPSRCRECRKALDTTSIRDAYCSSKCEDAGIHVRCTRCTPERKCNYCRSIRAPPTGKSKLDEILRESMPALKRWRNTIGHESRTADDDHEPAWKKRRRS